MVHQVLTCLPHATLSFLISPFDLLELHPVRFFGRQRTNFVNPRFLHLGHGVKVQAMV